MVDVDTREVVDADAAGEIKPTPRPEAELVCKYGVRVFIGRGVLGTAVCVEVVERDEEDEDAEGAGEAARGDVDV